MLRTRIGVTLAIVAIVSGVSRASAAADEQPDYAFSPVPDSRIEDAQPTPKFLYMFGAPARHTLPMHWKYNHTNAPEPFASNKAATLAQLQAALNKWTAACGFIYSYDGETATPPNQLIQGGQQPDHQNVVGWGPLDGAVSGLTYDWYATGIDRTLVDADTIFSTTRIGDIGALDRVATHEWGHALGLAHSNIDDAVMAGPPLTAYNGLSDLRADDIRGCRCLYGLPTGLQAPYACSLPSQLDFGSVDVGTTSPVHTVTLTNNGNAPLAINTVTVEDAQFQRVFGCDPGSSIAAGASCTVQLTVRPNSVGGRASRWVLSTNDGVYALPLLADGVAVAPPVAATVDVIEYYNATLDHYFITWVKSEQDKLDAGQTPTRWQRTGVTFKTYANPQTGSSSVCRYYMPPLFGDSHFFGRGSVECTATGQKNPGFVLEDAAFMQMLLPSAGVCPMNTQPIYRVFSNRADTNHRYMIDRAVRDQMIAKGWLVEGDGADFVVMCAPV